MKRSFRYTLFVITLLLAITLYGISGAEGAKKNVFRIGVTNQRCAVNYPAERAFIEAHPEVDAIEYVLLTEEQLRNAMISGNASFDLLILSYPEMVKYAQQGALMDLLEEGVFQSWPDGLLDIRDRTYINGHLYAMPQSLRGVSWIWNQDVAAIAEVEKPPLDWTWEDFDTLLSLVEGNKQFSFPLIYGGDSHILYPDVSFIRTMFTQLLNQSVLARKSYDSESFQKALQHFSAIFQADSIMVMDFNNLDSELLNNQLISLFSADDDPLWLCSIVPNYELITVPSLDREKPGTVMEYYLWAIPESAPQPEYAKAFIRGAFSNETLQIVPSVDNVFTVDFPGEIMYANIEPAAGTKQIEGFAVNENGEMVRFTERPDILRYATLSFEEYYGAELNAGSLEAFFAARRTFIPQMDYFYDWWTVFYPLYPEYEAGRISAEDLEGRLASVISAMTDE